MRYRRELVWLNPRGEEVVFTAEERPLLDVRFRCPQCGAKQCKVDLLFALKWLRDTFWSVFCDKCNTDVREAAYHAAQTQSVEISRLFPSLADRIQICLQRET
jgi:hypothetical protein